MIQVIIENKKTGKSYICKSYSETTKDITYYHITYSCILRHKEHPFFKQFYHGPNGIQIGTEKYKEIQDLEKAVIGAPLYKLLGLTITELPLDGRTRYAKNQLQEAITKVNNIVDNRVGCFQEPIIPSDFPTFDKGTANYVRERLELYLKSWVLPKLDEVLNE